VPTRKPVGKYLFFTVSTFILLGEGVSSAGVVVCARSEIENNKISNELKKYLNIAGIF
jgi:hypothetical protein